MESPYGIIVFGANGSGKTTLAQMLAGLLGMKHMDIETYHFMASEIPYTAPRSREDCIRLMLEDMQMYGAFVLSAVTGDFGEIIPSYYTLAVFLSAPAELRMLRIKQRDHQRYGKRVRKGGDMFEQQKAFHDFVSSRSLSKITQWAKTLSCPVLTLDGTADCHENAVRVCNEFTKNHG